MRTEEQLDALLKVYAQRRPDTPTEMLARMEHDIWNLVRLVEGPGRNFQHLRDWFYDKFGGSTSSYEIRSFIHRNSWARPLFAEIDKGLKHSTARDMYSKARDLAEEPGVTVVASLRVVIDAYNGTSESIRKARMPEQPSATRAHEPENATVAPITASKAFKSKVMHEAREFARSAVSGLDVEPVHVQHMLDGFEANLERIIRDLQLDISRRKSGAKQMGLDRIGESRFEHACEVLGLNARFGEKLDSGRVGKAFRNRAAPLRRIVDVAHGSSSLDERSRAASEELAAVNVAYEILRQYTLQQ